MSSCNQKYSGHGEAAFHLSKSTTSGHPKTQKYIAQ